MEGSFAANNCVNMHKSGPNVLISDDGNVCQLFGEIEALTISQDKILHSSDNGGNQLKALSLSDNGGFQSIDSYDSKLSHTDYDTQRTKMLDRLAKCDAHFKHQQKDEPDLTNDEKREIAADLLCRKPGIFLERFGNYLITSDISYFEQFSGDFYVEFHRKELVKRLDSSSKRETTIRNRRYEAMKRLDCVGDYFGDDEMKQRDPLFYEEMIGQHLSEAEISQMVDKSEGSLSGLLLKHLQVMQNNERYSAQKDMEECQEEEEDEEEEEKEEMENVCMDDDEKDSEEGKVLSVAEKAALRSEFLSTMHERFLKGLDRNFDYCAVDNNTDYDAVDMLNIDAEEKYFNDDDEDDDDELEADRSSLNSDSSNKMAE